MKLLYKSSINYIEKPDHSFFWVGQIYILLFHYMGYIKMALILFFMDLKPSSNNHIVIMQNRMRIGHKKL